MDVIYRSIDDDFLDPLCFRSESVLGVAGIVNAPGAGIADDKAVYAYVSDIIRHYLGENSILQNVPTYQLSNPDDRAFVLDNMERMVIKAARENARVVRDRISREMWEAMSELWLNVDRHLRRPLRAEKAPEFFAYVRNQVARFQGLTLNTMMRGEPFGFFLLGSFLERADMTARTLDVKYHMLLPDASMIGSPVDYYQPRASSSTGCTNICRTFSVTSRH